MKKTVIHPLVCFAMSTMITSISAYSATPIALQNTDLGQLPQAVQQMLPHAVGAPAMASVDSLQFIKQRTDAQHTTHLRMQQRYANIPVFGGYVILHKKASSQLSKHNASGSINGVVYADLAAELGLPKASFITNANEALLQFKARYPSGQITDASVTPIVYINESHQAFWAYQVRVSLQPDDGIPERPTAILDANTGHSFLSWNDVKTNRSLVKAQGYGGNSRTGLHQYGADYPFLTLMRDDATGICYVQNDDVSVIDMEHGYAPLNTAMAFGCARPSAENNAYWTGYQGDGYDAVNGAYSPSNDALYVGTVIKNLYSEWCGVPVLTLQDKPMKLVMRVHYGHGYENAFWYAQQMTFGDGANFMYPLVSLGIGAHEVSHGFTEQHADLVYTGQSGGMNESFSDMATQAAEWYSTGQNSWQVGHDILKESSGYQALRYMDKPSRDGWSIDRADQYRKGMDVHYSSGVYNRLFYVLANQPNWGVKKAFQVMVKANMDYWTPYSNFEQGGCGILQAATDLGFDRAGVQYALNDVAISYQQCNR